MWDDQVTRSLGQRVVHVIHHELSTSVTMCKPSARPALPSKPAPERITLAAVHNAVFCAPRLANAYPSIGIPLRRSGRMLPRLNVTFRDPGCSLLTCGAAFVMEGCEFVGGLGGTGPMEHSGGLGPCRCCGSCASDPRVLPSSWLARLRRAFLKAPVSPSAQPAAHLIGSGAAPAPASPLYDRKRGPGRPALVILDLLEERTGLTWLLGSYRL
jgi:hypothetical protein